MYDTTSECFASKPIECPYKVNIFVPICEQLDYTISYFTIELFGFKSVAKTYLH